jgi:general secretion pathway protein D/MSHA biogenesis protein MshL
MRTRRVGNVKKKLFFSVIAVVFLMVVGCVASQKQAKSPQEDVQAVRPAEVVTTPPKEVNRTSAVKDRKGFRLKTVEMEMTAGRPYLPIGAEILSKDGKVPLIQVVTRMADLKGFSVSWANDVNSNQAVDVHVRPEDNFWEALDNTLRQLDYFFEMDGDTIVVKYKETKRYRLVMPNLTENFTTAVGGNLIGDESQGKISGRTQMEVNISESLDFWKQVEENLDRIINSGALRSVQQAGGQQPAGGGGGPSYDQGFFITDKHLGLVTVTAPRKTHARVNEYLVNLKKEMYRMVIMEAKIVEVRLDDSHQYGINWSDLLSRVFSGTINFGSGGVIYPWDGVKFIEQVTLSPQNFTVIVDALKQYGETNILANPKITLMNGRGATIAVGENVTYIDQVESVTDENGNVTFTVTTATTLSGLGLAVMANIVNDEEVILYIVPVTSELQEPIEYRQFGGLNGAEVGLPRIRLRELATNARVRDGETLILGGLISKVEELDTDKVPLLGDIPGLGWLFKHEEKSTINRELAIFLQPRIISASF